MLSDLETPHFNLVFEESFYTLVKNSEERKAVLRFWRNDKTIVIGRYQCAALEVNAIEARRLGVKLVRRFTGGGAVYHDWGNLNYALAFNKKVANVESIAEAFKLVGEAVCKSLEYLGVDKPLFKPLNDIEVDGKKVSGLAASVSSKAVFVHGALLVSSDINTLWRVLRVSGEKLSDKFVRSRVKRVTTLAEILGSKVDLEKVVNVIAESIAEVLKAEITWRAHSEDELKKASELYSSKYSCLSWNLKYLDFVKSMISEEELKALVEIAAPTGIRRV